MFWASGDENQCPHWNIYILIYFNETLQKTYVHVR